MRPAARRLGAFPMSPRNSTVRSAATPGGAAGTGSAFGTTATALPDPSRCK